MPQLGDVRMVAASLYVRDLTAAVDWYRRHFGWEPVALAEDAHPYATFQVGSALIVLEPLDALLEGKGARGSGAATLNLVVERDPAEVRDELLDAGVECSRLVRSGFDSFLVCDPDGNRFYVTRPRREG